MNKKEYWLYGLIVGIIIFGLGFLFYYIKGINREPWGDLSNLVIAVKLSPVIILGLLIGWLYGKIKNRNKMVL